MTPLIAVKPTQPTVEYYVGKHSRPLSDYPLWARWLIRGVYFLTGYQVTAEAVAICSDELMADRLCEDASYFYKPLYVDMALPSVPCSLGPTMWPRSDARKLYEKRSPDMIAMTRHEFELLKGAVTEVCKSAHS